MQGLSNLHSMQTEFAPRKYTHGLWWAKDICTIKQDERVNGLQHHGHLQQGLLERKQNQRGLLCSINTSVNLHATKASQPLSAGFLMVFRMQP